MLPLKNYRRKDSPSSIHESPRPFVFVASETFRGFCFLDQTVHVAQFRAACRAYQGGGAGSNAPEWEALGCVGMRQQYPSPVCTDALQNSTATLTVRLEQHQPLTSKEYKLDSSASVPRGRKWGHT